jgi:hypothetical protein
VNGYAPVGVRFGRCRCRACQDAAQAACDAQRPPVPSDPPAQRLPAMPPPQGSRARVAAILSEVFSPTPEANS